MITLYLWDDQGIYVGSREVEPRSAMPPRSTPTAPPETNGEQVAQWRGQWVKLAERPVEPELGTEPAPEITSAMVDSERDRRISAGFEFSGTMYQSRPADWEVYSGKALDAFIAISSGAQPGDLRWSDPDSDFAWIAADNSRVPMDAQTVIELAKAASAHRTRLTFAGSDIKSLDPIPEDYGADWRWS